MKNLVTLNKVSEVDGKKQISFIISGVTDKIARDIARRVKPIVFNTHFLISKT